MKKRILVVDDEPEFTNLLKLSLESHGYYEVREENDAEHARAAAREFGPDLVVLDIMMPKLDGLEVLAALKAEPQTKEIPVVMLTARARDTDLWEGWDAGADYYITKPFDLEELLRFIGYLQVNGQLAGG